MENGFNLIWVLLQTIVTLAAVCGLAYLIFRVALPRLHFFSNTNNNMIRIVERAGLDVKHSLFVVEVAGKWMLIGVSEGNVNLVSELDAERAVAAELEISEARAEQIQKIKNLRSNFAEQLAAAINKKQAQGEERKQEDEKNQPAFSGKE